MPPPPEPPRGSSRRAPTWLLAIGIVLLIARIAVGIWENRNPPGLKEHVEWRPIAGAVEESRKSSRPILYDFSAEWCGPCKLMAAEVFADEKSARTLNTLFVPVRVVDRSREDGRNAPEVQQLQDRFEVQAFPTLIVYAPETGRHETITGYAGKTGTMQELTQALMKSRTTRGATPDTTSRH